MTYKIAEKLNFEKFGVKSRFELLSLFKHSNVSQD